MKKLHEDTNRQIKARLITIGESKRIDTLLGVCDAPLSLDLHSPRETRRMSMMGYHIQANAGQRECGLLLSPGDHIDEFDGDVEHALKSTKCEEKFVGSYVTPPVVVKSPTWKERTNALLERIKDLPGDQLVTLDELSADNRIKSATFTVEFVKKMVDKQD